MPAESGNKQEFIPFTIVWTHSTGYAEGIVMLLNTEYQQHK